MLAAFTRFCPGYCRGVWEHIFGRSRQCSGKRLLAWVPRVDLNNLKLLTVCGSVNFFLPRLRLLFNLSMAKTVEVLHVLPDGFGCKYA